MVTSPLESVLDNVDRLRGVSEFLLQVKATSHGGTVTYGDTTYCVENEHTLVRTDKRTKFEINAYDGLVQLVQDLLMIPPCRAIDGDLVIASSSSSDNANTTTPRSTNPRKWLANIAATPDKVSTALQLTKPSSAQAPPAPRATIPPVPSVADRPLLSVLANLIADGPTLPSLPSKPLVPAATAPPQANMSPAQVPVAEPPQTNPEPAAPKPKLPAMNIDKLFPNGAFRINGAYSLFAVTLLYPPGEQTHVLLVGDQHSCSAITECPPVEARQDGEVQIQTMDLTDDIIYPLLASTQHTAAYICEYSPWYARGDSGKASDKDQKGSTKSPFASRASFLRGVFTKMFKRHPELHTAMTERGSMFLSDIRPDLKVFRQINEWIMRTHKLSITEFFTNASLQKEWLQAQGIETLHLKQAAEAIFSLKLPQDVVSGRELHPSLASDVRMVIERTVAMYKVASVKTNIRKRATAFLREAYGDLLLAEAPAEELLFRLLVGLSFDAPYVATLIAAVVGSKHDVVLSHAGYIHNETLMRMLSNVFENMMLPLADFRMTPAGDNERCGKIRDKCLVCNARPNKAE